MPGSVNPYELVGGFLVSLALGAIGYRRSALSGSGVAGAVVTGTLVCGMGGWEWGLLLIAFFLSSSTLSFYRARDKSALAEKFAKGSRRDFSQALANGGVASLAALGSQMWPGPLWFAACAGALAAVNADTWATELGVLSRRLPRLITTGQQVEVGTSGGVTWLGSGAALGGALFIGLLSGLGALAIGRGWAAGGVLVLATAAGGLVGSLFDSLLGATLQAVYWCDVCGKETERRVHRCGAQTRRLRGWRWVDNDLVNCAASAVGALVAAGIGWGLQF